ncbi:MAG: PspA-associated protein PspAB [Acidimicrobiales bacterium]
MGLFDTLLGRTKPVQSNLDALFAIPSASITLQSAAGQSCSGHAGVCFKPPSGQGFEEMQSEVVRLLSMDEETGFRKAEDAYGYQWLVIEDADIEQLVTQVHLVNSSLSDAGWGPQLLCSVFGLADLTQGDTTGTAMDAPADPAVPEPTAGPGRVVPSTAYLVYLFKRGTFYPFVPDGHEHRDLERELKLKSLVADDLTIEPDLDRWFPLWDLPVG